ncbi:MAG TPA: homoserine kinase [Vicinamibacterales bacterium]|nr:homoserine kinase [Vicinamibacterales bacterium]
MIVPGSVANLGGGFDTLGVAVQVYLRARIVDVRDDGGTRLVVARSSPPVKGHNALERAFHLIAERTGIKTPTVYVEVESGIPMAAGLGSSAAATVAGLRIFEKVAHPLSDRELLAAATSIEGHADNAAPALFGGLMSVIADEGHAPEALHWTWPDELKLVVATPSVGLATSKARAALADHLHRRDAIFNMQRVLSLVHALQTGDYERLRESVRDRWHQPARSNMVPLLGDVLSLEDPDVLGAFLSGAGPSIAVIARQNFERLEQLLSTMYASAGHSAVVRTLAVHHAAVPLRAGAEHASATVSGR